MSPALPLDIISNIVSEVEYSAEKLDAEQLATLKACSLICRAWRTPSQRRILRKISFVDPKLRSLYAPYEYGRVSPSFANLLEVTQTDPTFLRFIQVLNIRGQWIISDVDFPNFITSITRVGNLRTFQWEVGCHISCPHWDKWPEDFRSSIQAILRCPKLTCLRLLGLCNKFPLEMVGYSPLIFLEIAGRAPLVKRPKPGRTEGEAQVDQGPTPIGDPVDASDLVKPSHFRLSGRIPDIMLYYMDRQDFRVDFSHLVELMVDGFDHDEILESFFYLCGNTLQSLTWRYAEYDLRSTEMSLRSLVCLRTLNIEALLDDPGPKALRCWSYSHLASMQSILVNSDLPKSLETINLTIDHCSGWTLNYDEAEGPHQQIQEDLYRLNFDTEISVRLQEIKKRGQLSVVNITFLVRDLKDAIEGTRKKVLGISDEDSWERESGATASHRSCGTVLKQSTPGSGCDSEDSSSEEEEEEEDSSNDEDEDDANASLNIKELDVTTDDEAERKCRADGEDSDDDHWSECYYLPWKHLARKVPEWLPHLKALDFVTLNIIDYEERPFHPFDRDIW